MALPLKFHNTVRAALGANYFLNENIKFLTGIAYDQSAMSNSSAVNFIDNNSLAVAAGVNYKLNKSFIFDVGYSHNFSLGAKNINTLSASGFQLVNTIGAAKRSENLLGAQITWNIGYLGTIKKA